MALSQISSQKRIMQMSVFVHLHVNPFGSIFNSETIKARVAKFGGHSIKTPPEPFFTSTRKRAIDI